MRREIIDIDNRDIFTSLLIFDDNSEVEVDIAKIIANAIENGGDILDLLVRVKNLLEQENEFNQY